MHDTHARPYGKCPRCGGPTFIRTLTARHVAGGSLPTEVCEAPGCWWAGRDVPPAPVAG